MAATPAAPNHIEAGGGTARYLRAGLASMQALELLAREAGDILVDNAGVSCPWPDGDVVPVTARGRETRSRILLASVRAASY